MMLHKMGPHQPLLNSIMTKSWLGGNVQETAVVIWQTNKGSEEMHRDEIEQTNARRRASYGKKVGDGVIDLREKNQKLQEWRVQHPKTMTEDERGESSAKRKAKYAAKKNTPCAESIAMPRPDLTSTLSNPHTHCPTLTLPTITQQSGSEQIDLDTTVKSAPTYIRNTETDGSYPINGHLSFCNHSSYIYNDSEMCRCLSKQNLR